MNPAIEAGELAKARRSFMEFDEKWDSIEDLVKERDVKAYNTIEDGMTNIGLALKPATPDANKVQTPPARPEHAERRARQNHAGH